MRSRVVEVSWQRERGRGGGLGYSCFRTACWVQSKQTRRLRTIPDAASPRCVKQNDWTSSHSSSAGWLRGFGLLHSHPAALMRRSRSCAVNSNLEMTSSTESNPSPNRGKFEEIVGNLGSLLLRDCKAHILLPLEIFHAPWRCQGNAYIYYYLWQC